MKAAIEVTGLKLKVGDVVRRAMATSGYTAITGKPRELADMDGTIIQFFPRGGSGGGKPQGSAKVLWASGSTASHDALMLEQEAQRAPGRHLVRRQVRGGGHG